MASEKFIKLQDFTDQELTSELNDTEAQYQKLKFDHAIKGLDNPIMLQEVRRDIARLKTEMRKRELAKMSEQEKAKRSKLIYRRSKS
jgi:large subunit ribosomal protein L29